MFGNALDRYTSTKSSTRYLGLDLLRAVAVIGVILCHSYIPLPFSTSGWAGVDLFFVLSGFLVTGLLIQEYKQHHTVQKRRFFIRRSFKILPPFYALILAGSLQWFFTKGSFPAIKYLIIEFAFLQSYYEGIWWHTWTLAVEEQFYLFLLLFFALLIPLRRLEKPQLALLILAALWVLVVASRFWYVFQHLDQEVLIILTTHTRADGLLIGAICAFLFHYYPRFRTLFQQNRLGWLLVSAACIAPLFLYPAGSFVMNTWGQCLLHIGFAVLVLLSLDLKISGFEQRAVWAFPFLRLGALIGFHSYSIYLWHSMSRDLAYTLFADERIATSIYIVLSLCLGVAMSVVIEQRFLLIRDRFFPRVERATPLPASDLSTQAPRPQPMTNGF